MSHLTDEQLEEIMQGVNSQTAHLEHCDTCTERLAEQRALARRLRSAFAAVKPDKALAEQIRGQLNAGSTALEGSGRGHILNIRSHWQRWLGMVSAAAALIIVVSLVTHLLKPSSAAAAQAALVRIHEHNLSGNHEFYSEADPEKLADYFKNKLGFSPSMPHPGQGLALRGCCVRHFRGKIVGSYVVETDNGVMSIVVVTDPPESLGMAEKFRHGQHVFWKSSFAKCDMVTARLGQYSYCAVGEISHSYLTELLARLLRDSQQ